MVDYVELKKLAEAANQSMPDWERDVMCESDLSTVGLDYAAAMSPAVTLRLLEIIEVAKEALGHYRDWMQDDGIPDSIAAEALAMMRKLEADDGK